jgi:MFS family permease
MTISKTSVPFSPSPRTAVSTIFAIIGFVSAGWIARIPALTAKLDMDTAQLGALLLFIAVGSLIAFQFIGRWIEHYGSERTTLFFTLVFIVALVALALSPVPAVLGVGLFFYGAAFGAADVAMNAQGVTVERRLKRPIMGSLHGFFSFGALAGAAVSAVLAGAGVGLEANLILFAVIAVVLTVWANLGMVQDDPIPAEEKQKGGGGFSLPPRALWPMGVIAFCGAVGEGSLADWGALYVHDELGSSEGMAAFGFTVFSTTMLAGRFVSDQLVVRFGAEQVVRVGAVIAAIGLLAGLVPNVTWAAIAGFAVMGIGLASVFPVVYSAAGSIPGIPSGRGVAAVATMGYTGFLAGPPVLGFLARATSIQVALMVVAALIALIPFYTKTLRKAAPVDTVPAATSQVAD